MAEWLGSRTCDEQVAGSHPGRRAVECNRGQLVYTHVPLSPSSIVWYELMGGDDRQLGLAESNGSLSPGLWLRCGLTAEDRDQLRNPTLVSSTGLPYLYPEETEGRRKREIDIGGN